MLRLLSEVQCAECSPFVSGLVGRCQVIDALLRDSRPNWQLHVKAFGADEAEALLVDVAFEG